MINITLQELTSIIEDTLVETEQDLKRYALIIKKVAEITIQVMDVMKDLKLDTGDRTRSLTNAIMVQKIVGNVREKDIYE